MPTLRIKQLVRDSGMTIARFASAMGYRNASSVSQTLSRGKMSLQWLERAAGVLGVGVADLFEKSHDTITCPYCGKTIIIETMEEPLQKKNFTKA